MKEELLTLKGIFDYYFKFKHFDKIPSQVVEEYQFKKLKRLLVECINVPYYQNLFKTLGFDPQYDFSSINDLKLLQTLNKSVVRANPELFINPKWIKKSITSKTSGTTGTPFTSYISYNHWTVEQAVIWRHWKWAGYRFRDSMAILRSINPKNENELIKIDKIRNWTYYSPYHLNDKHLKIFYQDMIKRKIKILRGYPSSLLLFAEFCLNRGLKIPYLKACLTASEVLTEKERQIIENAFNVKIFDHYGLAEAIVMLHNRGEKYGYVNCEEYGYLELIPTKNNNYSKIIGTNLNNYAMPLIRYDTEDLVETFDSKFDNKRNLTIKRIIGRKDTYIQTTTNKIPTINIYTTMYKVDGIIQWQIIQNDLNSLDVYLNIKEGYNFNVIANEIEKLNNTGLKLNFLQTKIFSLVGEGKLKPFISNI